MHIFIYLLQNILPKGTVRDETTFLILISVLIVLVGVAMVLRRRRM